MKKSSLLAIGVIVIVLTIGAWKAYDRMYFKKVKQQSEFSKRLFDFKCHYMAYACGDCYPQWKVDSGFAVENDLKELMEEDLYVTYKGSDVQGSSLPDSVNKCIICYDFYFTGTLKKTLRGKYQFEADTFKMKLRSKDCCN